MKKAINQRYYWNSAVIFISGALALTVAFSAGCEKSPEEYFGYWYGFGTGAGCFPTVTEMKKNLDLNREQVRKIEKIDKQYRQMYLKNKGNYDKIEQLREKHRSSIENILTPTQLKEYEEAYTDRWFCGAGIMYGTRPMMSGRWHIEGAHQRGYYHGHGHGMGHGAGCFRSMAAMTNVLDLDETQKQKIEQIDSRYREKYYNKRGDADAIDNLKEEHKSSIMKVLDREQKEIYREYYNRRHRC